MLNEALESPAFWILAGLGIGAEVLGYIASKNAGLAIMPIWMLLVMMLVTIGASAFFATQG